MPLLKLDSNTVLRALLQLSPKKKRLFKQKLAARKAAEASFARKAALRRLHQPTSGNPVGLGWVEMRPHLSPFIEVPVSPRRGRVLTLSGRKKGFNPGGVKAYAFTRTQSAALRGLKPAKRQHKIEIHSTLPPNWASNYMSMLYFLSGKYKKDPEAEKAIRVLKRMSRDLYIENRGEAFVPRPDSLGFYPVYSNIPYSHVQTAIRKNTSKRVRWASWLRVAASGRPYRPPPEKGSTLTEQQKKHFMAHAAVGLPHKKGRYPALLGKAVPGQLTRRSGSVVSIKDIDPEEWAKGGFTSMKFEIPQDCIQYYENGLREGLARKWRGMKWKMKQVTRPVVRWVRLKLLPAASEGAIKGTITSLQQQTGMLPPTTVDLQPVRIKALSSAYRDIPDDSLKSIAAGLRSRLQQEANPELVRAIQRKIADIQVELAGRRFVPMTQV